MIMPSVQTTDQSHSQWQGKHMHTLTRDSIIESMIDWLIYFHNLRICVHETVIAHESAYTDIYSTYLKYFQTSVVPF